MLTPRRRLPDRLALDLIDSRSVLTRRDTSPIPRLAVFAARTPPALVAERIDGGDALGGFDDTPALLGASGRLLAVRVELRDAPTPEFAAFTLPPAGIGRLAVDGIGRADALTLGEHAQTVAAAIIAGSAVIVCGGHAPACAQLAAAVHQALADIALPGHRGALGRSDVGRPAALRRGHRSTPRARAPMRRS